MKFCSARCLVLIGALCVATVIYVMQWEPIEAVSVRPPRGEGHRLNRVGWQQRFNLQHHHNDDGTWQRSGTSRLSPSGSNISLLAARTSGQKSCFPLHDVDGGSGDAEVVDLPLPRGLDDAPGPGPLTRCIWNATSVADLGSRFVACRAHHLRRMFEPTSSATSNARQPDGDGGRAEEHKSSSSSSSGSAGSVVCHVDCAFAGLTNQLLCSVYHIVGCLLVGSTEIVFDELANSRTRTNFGFRYGQNADRRLWASIPQSLIFDMAHLRDILERTLHIRYSTRPNPRPKPEGDIVLAPHHTDVIGMEMYVAQSVTAAVRRTRRLTIAGARNALHRSSAHYFKLSRVSESNQRRVWPLTLLKLIMTQVFRLAAYSAPPSPMGSLFRHLRQELLANHHMVNGSLPSMSSTQRTLHEEKSEASVVSSSSYGVYHYRAEEDFTSFLRVAGFGVRPTPSAMLDRFLDVKNRVFPFVRRWYIASGIFNEPESLSSMVPQEREYVFRRLKELRAGGEIVYADYESPVRKALRRYPLEVSAAFDLFMAFEGDAVFGQHQTSFATASCAYLLFRGNGCIMLDNFNPFFSASLWIHLYHWYPKSIQEQMAQWTDRPEVVEEMKKDIHMLRWDL